LFAVVGLCSSSQEMASEEFELQFADTGTGGAETAANAIGRSRNLGRQLGLMYVSAAR